MNKKNLSEKYGRLMLVLLVLMVSAMVVLPSGCLDSEEEQGPISPDNGSSDEDDLVDENPDSTIEFSEDDTSSEQDDDTEDSTPSRSFSSGSQVVDPPFTSGGDSDSSSTPEVVEDVNIEIPSGNYVVTETHVANLTIVGETSGTITLPDTLTIDGNLNVYTPDATVNNYATVGGTITIIQVADETWNQYGDAGKIVMQPVIVYNSLGFEPMDKSSDQTLNLMSGNIPGGIDLGRNSILQINGGSTPNVNLLDRATVIVNNAASNLPKINVTPNAEDSNIDNLADEPLNLELHTNVTVSGNVNPDNDSYAHEITSRGSLTVSPTVCPIGNESVTLTYTMGQDIVNGTIGIDYFSMDITGATYSIANGENIALESEPSIEFTEINISKGQQIILSFGEQELTNGHTFYAYSNNSSIRSGSATAILKVLNNDAGLSYDAVIVDGNLATDDGQGNYSTDVPYDVESTNVTINIRDLAASIIVNGDDVRDDVKKEITLNEPGTSTEVPIVVTAEDGVTTGTYTLTINRAPTPVATPTASPVAGLYFENQSIELSTATEGASIYYTTDETDPTNESILYADAIDISANTTIKAIGIKDGMANSSIATFAYIMGDSAEVVPIVDTTFDKNPAEQDFVGFEITSNDAGNISEVRNGDTILVNNTDYDITDHPFDPQKEALGIYPSYLAGLETGTTNLTIDFEYGEDAVVSIDVIESISAAIDPTSATFDKNPVQQQNITVNITLNDAESQTSIENSGSSLIPDTDFFRGANYDNVTIVKEYLNGLPVGETNLTIGFNRGEYANLTVNIIDTTVSATISPENATFDKNPAEQENVTTIVTFNNATTVANITNGGSAIGAENYTFDGTNITILKDYLALQTVGDTVLSIEFDAGEPADLTINVSESRSATLSPTSATFDKNIAEQENVTVEVALEDANEITNITNGGSAIGTDNYAFDGTNLTILKDYLILQDVGDTVLSIDFDVGESADLTIVIENSTSATISPEIETFDRTYPTDVETIISIEDAGELVNITDNTGTLESGTDYTLTGSTLVINSSYLSSVSGGSLELILEFAKGEDAVLTIDITKSADLKRTVGYFDLNPSNQTVVGTDVYFNDASSIIDIKNSDLSLTEDTDYSFNGNEDTLQILVDYLDQFGEGESIELLICFDAGENATLTINIIDTAPTEITGFAALGEIDGGYADDPTYANAEAVQDSLPANLTATTDDGEGVIVNVSSWINDDSYDGTEGRYNFTAELDTLPEGYANTGGYTATVEVVVAAARSTDAGLATVLEQPINTGAEAGTSGEPKTASISVAYGVDSIEAANITTSDPAAIIEFYGTNSTFETMESGNVALTAGGDKTVYIKVTAENEANILYYAVTITRAAPSTVATLSKVLSETISVDSGSGTDDDPNNASISVVNGVANVGTLDSHFETTDSGASVDFYGTDDTFTTIDEDGVELTQGANTSVYIKVTAEDTSTILYYVVNIFRAAL